MINKRTIFLYGPQTAGKTTRLLRIIQRDHGRDILMSGEDRNRVNNGREVCDITLRAPDEWNTYSKVEFLTRINKQLPIKHVLIDGAQFMSVVTIKMITKLFRQVVPDVPIIFTGCRYYISTTDHFSKEIPTSQFLMRWCERAVPVNRKCDFCGRLATRLLISGYQRLRNNKIVAKDPHLVCDFHYRQLINR